MDQGIAALLGALVGGLIAGLAAWLLEIWRARALARNMSVAAASEASAVAEMVRRRQWMESLASYANAARQGHVERWAVYLPDAILPVSRSAQQQAGSLRGSLPTIIPRLVIRADGIVADIRRLSLAPIGHPDSMLDPANPKAAADFYTEMFAVMAATLYSCDELVIEAKRLYPEQTSGLKVGRTQMEMAFPVETFQ